MPIATVLKSKVAAVVAFCEKELVLQVARLGDEYESVSIRDRTPKSCKLGKSATPTALLSA